MAGTAVHKSADTFSRLLIQGRQTLQGLLRGAWINEVLPQESAIISRIASGRVGINIK